MIVILVSLTPISFGLLMAYYMGWGGMEFSYAVFHEPTSYVPILIGFLVSIIGLLGLLVMYNKKNRKD
ncbi:hypothetical protein ASG93_13595 [Paenibacillus sp. Soil787]|nr:hypothetical protein ASG93_13595 [Paenibacillus sp. Soil787]